MEEPAGRVTLPGDARGIAGRTGAARGMARGDALVIRREVEDARGTPGTRLLVDARGRLQLPAWLRRACPHGASVLVAAQGDGPSTVVVVPAAALDAVVDRALGPDVAEVG